MPSCGPHGGEGGRAQGVDELSPGAESKQPPRRRRSALTKAAGDSCRHEPLATTCVIIDSSVAIGSVRLRVVVKTLSDSLAAFLRRGGQLLEHL